MLNSGEGALGVVDLPTGRFESVIELPGFTRGLHIVGDHAVVGLSRVRDPTAFAGLPLTERLPPEQRMCGVALVDLRAGELVGWARLASSVHEVFEVRVLPAPATLSCWRRRTLGWLGRSWCPSTWRAEASLASGDLQPAHEVSVHHPFAVLPRVDRALLGAVGEVLATLLGALVGDVDPEHLVAVLR